MQTSNSEAPVEFLTSATTPQAREVFDLQKQAYANDPFPSEKLRKQQLKALKKALLKHQDKLAKAISADFGCRSVDETKLADIMPTILNLNHTLKHLRHWMKSETRSVSLLFQPASASIMYQPLGVVGIMSPWNYPVYLLLGPLIAAIAAGNRVMVKPSEFCPYSNRVLNEILREAFTPDEVFMVEGDAEVAASFTGLPFDHLLFTGSTNVGKKVMAAAAPNLTPVTLELGGKSPVIIAPDVSAEFAAERLLYGKCLNAGQTCVAPDYVLCPNSLVEKLVAQLKQQFDQLFPDISNGDYSSIINQGQFERLSGWLDDAKQKGASVTQLSSETKAELLPQNQRVLPPLVLTNVSPEMKVMQDEIFGPLLPIIGYDTVENAIKMVNKLPRPLALYLFSNDKKLQQSVVKNTHAGGVCINEVVNHVAQDDLPFGGVGPSGMGSYHAKEGFLTFSHAKSIFKRGRFHSAKLAYPPYGKFIHRFIYRWLLR